MALTRNDLITIRQYLLGQVAAEAQQDIEQRLLREDDLFQELEIAEDELVDEYVANELEPADRQRFEQYFLSTPEREHQLRFATTLHRYASTKTVANNAAESSVVPAELNWLERMQLAWAGQTQLLRIAVIAAVLVVIVPAVWLVRPRYSPQSYATVTLTISYNNRAESSQVTKVKLPLGADALRLYLKLPDASDPAMRYRVELLREADEATGIERVAVIEHSAVIEIPAAQLARGQYALNLYMIKPGSIQQRISGSYFLIVE